MNIFFRLILVLFFTNFIFQSVNADEVKVEATAKNQDIIVLYNSNRLEEAYLLISQIPEEQRDSELWLILANITQDYDKDEDAFNLIQKAITANKENYKAYYNLGNLYFKQNKILLAIENYKLATKYNKSFAYSYYNLGCCYLKDSQFAAAKKSTLQAIKINKLDPVFYYNLALIYKKMNNLKQAQKALEIYDKLSSN